MSNAQWIDVEDDITDAEGHFTSALALFESGRFDDGGLNGYRDRMALMHALQAAHTSAEKALQRVLRILDEDQPVGEDWHRTLIARLAKPLSGEHARPAVLSAEVASDLDETRRFRHIAMRSYGTFDARKTVPSIDAARRLATTLAAEIRRFREAIDPAAR